MAFRSGKRGVVFCNVIIARTAGQHMCLGRPVCTICVYHTQEPRLRTHLIGKSMSQLDHLLSCNSYQSLAFGGDFSSLLGVICSLMRQDGFPPPFFFPCRGDKILNKYVNRQAGSQLARLEFYNIEVFNILTWYLVVGSDLYTHILGAKVAVLPRAQYLPTQANGGTYIHMSDWLGVLGVSAWNLQPTLPYAMYVPIGEIPGWLAGWSCISYPPCGRYLPMIDRGHSNRYVDIAMCFIHTYLPTCLTIIPFSTPLPLLAFHLYFSTPS